MWALFTVALTLTVRASVGRRLVGRTMRGRIGKPAFGWLYVGLQVIPAAVVAWVLFLSLPTYVVWQSLGAFGLGVLLESYTFWRERELIALEYATDTVEPSTVAQMAKDLRGVHSFSAYQRMHVLILVALQVTLIMAYTFIGVTTQEFLTCMLVSVGCMVITREGTEFFLSHRGKRGRTVQVLMVGLFLWLYGLILFYRQLSVQPQLILSYFSLGLCACGLTITVTCLAELERDMVDVAEYGLQNHLEGYGRMRAVNTELGITLGQMLALILLTILCVPQDIAAIDWGQLTARFKPLMCVPPLLLVLGAVLSALRFPLNGRYFDKLKRFLTLTDEDNPALKKQLDNVVVARHKNRFGVKVIVWLLRPLYWHKVIGRENLQGYEEGTIILVCNHGELYGPIATNLYVPISFRPWCISSIMEKDVIVDYVYQNTIVRQKWCPDFLKLPITRALSPVFLWVFNSLEAIPVYRGNPRALIKTFRLTVEAMQAGDNILVFPETGEPEKAGEKGYVTEGVGDLYTGFAMIAPAFYAKTKKRAVFVPIYASRHLRTITFGKGVVYDPDAPANEEKLRIVHELQRRMQAMYDVELDTLAKRRDKDKKKPVAK